MIWGLSRRASGSAFCRLALASASVLALASAGRALAADADAPISTAAGEAPAAVLGAQAAAPSGAVVLADNSSAQTTSATATQDNPYAKLGTNPLLRLWNYEVLELGKSSAPVDPTAPPAPPSVRDGWTPPPQTNPPMPFTDWPYGGTTALGDNRTASVDSPLMVALAPTALGKAMARRHPDVRLGRRRWQHLDQQEQVRQCAGGLRLQSERHPARPGRPLCRAYARHGSDRSHRLGLPGVGDLRRELPLYDRLRYRELSAPEG